MDWNDDDSATLRFSADAMETVGVNVVVDDDDVQRYVVNSLADVVAVDGVITLREALEAANTNTAVGDAPAGSPFGCDVITFAPELFTDGTNPLPGTITLGKGLSITDSAGVDIQGPGTTLLTIDANKTFYAFRVRSTMGGVDFAEATISGMTITRARSMGSSGGAIMNSGLLTLVDMNISGNAGWGIYSERCPLSVIDSTISGNRLGGIYFTNASDSFVINSTISGNTSGQDGGGICCRYGRLWIIDSTISGNTIDSTISGNITDLSRGGGVYVESADLRIENSAISGNTADYGGGIYNVSANILVTNSTIAGNTAGDSGGGIFSTNLGGYISDGSTTIDNSIVALNTAPTDPDVSGAFAPGSSNNLIGVDPLFVRNPSPGADGKWGTADDDLGDLHLRAGSPAINTGSNAMAIDAAGTPFATDLDGKDRIIYGTVDIGAYEFDDLWALSDTYDVANGEPAVLDVLANDLYPSDPATSIEIIVAPQFGALTVNPDGTVSYSPYCDFTYTDSFQYRLVADGKTSSEATVTLNLTGTGGISVSTAEDELDADYTPGDLSLREALLLRRLIRTRTRSRSTRALAAKRSSCNKASSSSTATSTFKAPGRSC